jgi:hypothetical protein
VVLSLFCMGIVFIYEIIDCSIESMQIVDFLFELHPELDLLFVLQNILGKISAQRGTFYLLLPQLHILCFHGILN